MKYQWVFWLGWIMNATFADPFFKVSSAVWEENSKILVANCPTGVSRPGVDFLQSPEKNGALLLDMVQDLKAPYFYTLWAEGPGSTVLLMQRSDETNPAILKRVVLPFAAKRGTLTLARVFLSQQWQTLLLLTVTEKTGQQSLLQIFDVTYPTEGLRQLWAYDFSQVGGINTRPIVVRLPSQTEGILFASSKVGIPCLQFIDLSVPKTVRSISIDAKLPERLSAIDSKQSGVVDKLYMSDGTALFAATWREKEQKVAMELLVKGRVDDGPLVVRDPKGWGHRLYLIGEIMGERGVFLVEESEGQTTQEVGVQLIAAGEFLAIFVRYGQLWVIPRAVSEVPFVLKMPFHQRVKLASSPQYLGPGHHRIHAALVWDALLAEERLIFLNDSCQLNIFLFRKSLMDERSGWRKILP